MNVSEFDVTFNATDTSGSSRIHVLWLLRQNLMRAVQTCKCFADVTDIRHDLKNRQNKKGHIHRISKKFAQAHELSSEHTAADDHDSNAHDTHEQRRLERDCRLRYE